MESTQGSGRSSSSGGSEGSFQLRLERSLKKIEDSTSKVEHNLDSSSKLHEETMRSLRGWAGSHTKAKADDVSRLNTIVDGHQRMVIKLQQDVATLLLAIGELKRVQTELKQEEVVWRRNFAVDYAAYSDAHMMHMFNQYDGNPPPVGSDQQRVEKLFVVPKVDSETGADIVKKKKKVAGGARASKAASEGVPKD